jgi:hypothetical protein
MEGQVATDKACVQKFTGEKSGLNKMAVIS